MKYIIMDFKDGDFFLMNFAQKKKPCRKQRNNGTN